MTLEKRELRRALKSVLKGLIIQEVRALQLEQAQSPTFITEDMTRSIQETKGKIMGLVRFMPPKERDVLLKRLVRQSVDEEIEQAIRVREKRCFRCVYVRYFDEAGSSHANLPSGKEQAQGVGCEITSYGNQCQTFLESPMATPIEDYVNAMAFLYELREMFDDMDEIWDYLTK
jgi:hypothetical protein